MTTTTTFSSPPAKPALWRWLASSLTQHERMSAYFEPLIQLALPHWSSDSWRARVVEVRTELPDVFTLVIRPSRFWRGFAAGQFVELLVEKDGVRNSRCFSISSSPEHYARTGLIELTIRIQQGGRITPWLKSHFAQGGICNLSHAQGDFRLPEGEKPLLMIAGGSGLTPFRSILQQMALSGDNRPVHLMYYARDEHSWLFRDELQRFMLDLPDLTASFIDSSDQGFISADHLQRYCPDAASRTLMICGPSAMIRQARRVAAEAGLAAADVHFEYFGAAPVDRPDAAEGSAIVSFVRSGVVSDVSADTPQSLLEVAEEAGLKPVSGCRIGVCHQCICRKKSGVVFNTQTGRYSDTGPEEIQLCVSVASGDLVLEL